MEPSWGLPNSVTKVATPQIIRALVEAVGLSGYSSNSARSVCILGPRSLPYLLPLLGNDDKWDAATGIIRNWYPVNDDYRNQCTEWYQQYNPNADAEIERIARDFAQRAADSRQPRQLRLGVLRALDAFGEKSGPIGRVLLPVLRDADEEIRHEGFRTLGAVRDVDVLGEMIDACPRMADEFSSFRPWSVDCLSQLVNYGKSARPIGAKLIDKFLNSANGSDRAAAATALGYIGYEPAIPRLIYLLEDNDWRVVYAATRSLGWFNARNADAARDKVARTHWLPELRQAARDASPPRLAASGEISPFNDQSGYQDEQYLRLLYRFRVESSVLRDANFCTSGRWSWAGIEFSMPSQQQKSLNIPADGSLPAGQLVAIGGAKELGELSWHPQRGRAVVLHRQNIVGVMPTHDGAIALVNERGLIRSLLYDDERGADAYGYAIHVARDDSGGWRLKEIARFPKGSDAFKAIGPDLYAAVSGGRMIVFSSERILGLASCIDT